MTDRATADAALTAALQAWFLQISGAATLPAAIAAYDLGTLAQLAADSGEEAAPLKAAGNAWYESVIGYDPEAEGWNDTAAELMQAISDYLIEEEDAAA